MPALEPDKYYHIYNRANGNELIFTSAENYRFFLEKYNFHTSPVADTFCFCLMPNHFHFLVKIKSEMELTKAFPKFQTLGKTVSKQFSNLFSSYTQAFNKQKKRKGSLFMKNFKRKSIEDEKYLRKLVHYIHFNPVEAGLCKTPEEWMHSSYAVIISKSATLLKKEEVIEWFNDMENFIHVHKQAFELTGI